MKWLCTITRSVYSQDTMFHPIFPKFTALQPASRIRDPNSNDPVTLNCQISPQNAATNFSIIWEHNGVPINNLSMYEQNSLNGMSTLTIRRPSLVESEGRYRCRVNYHRDSYGNFSLSAERPTLKHQVSFQSSLKFNSVC